MKVLNRGKNSSRKAFGESIKPLIDESVANEGEGVGILVGESTSPTRARLLAEIAEKLPNASFYKHEAITNANADEASDKAFGKGVRQVLHLGKAKRILSLDSDFLGLEALSAGAVSDFMSKRKPEDINGDIKHPDPKKIMNRLYCVESRYTLTGGMADHRQPISAAEVAAVAVKLGEQLGDDDVNKVRQSLNAEADKSGTVRGLAKWIEAAAKDLKEHKGESLVVAGLNQPPAVHALVAAINKALGAYGKVIELVQTPTDGPELLPLEAVATQRAEDEEANKEANKKALAEWEEQKAAHDKKQANEKTKEEFKEFEPIPLVYRLKHLFLLGPSNPVYDTPADFDWATIHKALTTTVHVGHRVDATAKASTWHVPAAHYLESWGDVRDCAGVYSVVQPMILPLFNGLSEMDVLLAFLGKKELAPAPAAMEEEAAEEASEGEAEKEGGADGEEAAKAEGGEDAADGEPSEGGEGEAAAPQEAGKSQGRSRYGSGEGNFRRNR